MTYETARGHDERLNKEKIKFVNFISFFAGFSQAVLAYIISSYFKERSGTENVGLYFIIAYLAVFFILINFHKIIKKVGKSYAFLGTFLAQTVSLLVLAVSPGSFWGIIFMIIYIVAVNLSVVGLDIILESFSVDKMSGRLRGLYLALLDAGFILGPLASTITLGKYGFRGVFLFAFIINFFVFLLALKGLMNVNHRYNGRATVKEIIKKIWQRKNVMRIYYISFILEAFYSIMIIFTPLYLRGLGLAWEQIGFIFTVMLIPFLIFPYPAGFLADTKYGEKEMLIFALLTMGASTLLIYFIDTVNIFAWAAILFSTRVGAAIIQTLRDSYFYKRVDGRDVDIIDFFRTSSSLAYVLSVVVATVVLIFFQMKFIFIFLSILIFSGLYPLLKLADNKPC